MTLYHLCLGDDLCSQEPLAYPGQAVFLTAPYPTQAVAHTLPISLLTHQATSCYPASVG